MKGDFDRELVELFKEEILESIKSNYVEKLYDLVVEHIYGKGARDPHMYIDWRLVFEGNGCPACNDLLHLEGENYFCEKCSLTLSVKDYDLAASEYKNKVSLNAKDRLMMEKVKKLGYTQHQLNLITDLAKKEVEVEMQNEKK